MSKKLTEMYPKEQRYGNGVGAAPARGRTASPRPTESISTDQKLDSTDAIEVFQSTKTKGRVYIKRISWNNVGRTYRFGRNHDARLGWG